MGRMRDIFTVSEAASFLHKHPDTIRSWIKNKKLKARKISAGGEGVFVILRSDLLELVVTESFKEKSKTSLKKKSPKRSSSQEKLRFE